MHYRSMKAAWRVCWRHLRTYDELRADMPRRVQDAAWLASLDRTCGDPLAYTTIRERLLSYRSGRRRYITAPCHTYDPPRRGPDGQVHLPRTPYYWIWSDMVRNPVSR